MLKDLQTKYAEKPVRFLLFPCNQFAAQEPGTNAEIKSFAEQSVKLGPGSNVIMFAKSNLNNVTCTASADTACTPSSAACCPTNDPIYEFLLSNTDPGKIGWNFDKIIVDGSGKPFPGETILHGGDLAAQLGAAISKAAKMPVAFSEMCPGYPMVILLIAVVGVAIAVKVTQTRKQQQDYFILE
eukprot:gnl/TRDRNA2_/TRDRNA2_44725_c0_seq1.p1 gnl/TRDRNA2_/TRDRNA2_44725_c0~~gnl/TRDRNA2_/TRDRNA2_44725_c0_seq1.p1  ORF type:complete len:184 (-),score=35.62 gnl/TRDRNA2_/TRDRNA2_44725_c0_seq1:375-926(-)